MAEVRRRLYQLLGRIAPDDIRRVQCPADCRAYGVPELWTLAEMHELARAIVAAGYFSTFGGCCRGSSVVRRSFRSERGFERCRLKALLILALAAVSTTLLAERSDPTGKRQFRAMQAFMDHHSKFAVDGVR